MEAADGGLRIGEAFDPNGDDFLALEIELERFEGGHGVGFYVVEPEFVPGEVVKGRWG